MRSTLRRRSIQITLAAVALLGGERACPQSAGGNGDAPANASTRDDTRALGELVRQLQAQVEKLNARVTTLEASEKNAKAETTQLRRELEQASSRLPSATDLQGGGVKAQKESSSTTAGYDPLHAAAVAGDPKQQEAQDSPARLQEDVQLANSKIQEQSQTKVESSSKYRVRLSGLALFNLFANRGAVDNQDFPQVAARPSPLRSDGTFGGSLRQSQIGLEAFGPEIAGARTSAELRFDFGANLTQAPNGNLLGMMRLRTGTARFDWANTSIIAGQDYLFFSPLAPTSYATLAIPALSYSGNLWGWTPQVRVEHRVHVSESSTILLQGGILEALSGDMPALGYERDPTRGEQSGQPAYATRVSWSHPGLGGNFVLGGGGYYGRQTWGFERNVNSWAATADLTLPLGRFLELAGQFYRGQAVGGLGGGIGQSVLWNGLLVNSATEVAGLDSLGGWMQLKVKPAAKFEFNAAVGDDNPFADDLRPFRGNPIYANGLFSKNLTALGNLIYRPRSDVVFSLEYRRLKTFMLDRGAEAANHINLSVGYIF